MKSPLKRTLIPNNGFCVLLMVVLAMAKGHCAMSVNGLITTSGVDVTGSVTMSTMTVSSLTVTGILDVTGNAAGLPRSIHQMVFSSTTVTTFTSSPSYVPVPDLISTITLSNATNYIRISLTGMLEDSYTQESSAYLTIMRDSSVDLGNTVSGFGLAACTSHSFLRNGGFVSAGITITDSPGDTNPHTYQVFIRITDFRFLASFPAGGIGYLLLEETQI